MGNWEDLPLSDRRSKHALRLKTLLAFDRTLLKQAEKQYAQSFFGILGVDEVGRGSLIGPIVAAALVLPSKLSPGQKKALALLDDSKAPHFTHVRRLALADTLKEIGYWGIGEASLHEVETLNVAQASLLAGHRAIMQLQQQFPKCCLEHYLVVLDGRMTINGLTLCQWAQVKADKQSAAVAGASVIAKAHRDELVICLAQDYPGYQWETNAGYPTPSHQEALRTLGVTPLHRKTYKLVQQAMANHQQQLLPLGSRLDKP